LSLNRESVLIRGERIKEGKGADFGRESRLIEMRRRMSGSREVKARPVHITLRYSDTPSS